FDVRTVFAVSVRISEIAVPRVTERVIAPRPLLFPRRDVMARDVDDPGLLEMIVTAEEIFVRTHAHVTARRRNVRVKRQVVRTVFRDCGLRTVRRNELSGPLVLRNTIAPALPVIDAIIESVRERIFTHSTPRVVGDVIHIRRKETLVTFVDASSDVGPP